MEQEIRIIGHVDGIELKVITFGKVDYVAIDALLYAMGASDIKKASELFQSDLYFYQSFKSIEIDGKPTLVLDLVNVLGFIHRIPGDLIGENRESKFSILRNEVFTAYRIHCMNKTKFYQWKLEGVLKAYDEYSKSVNEQLELDEHLIELQKELIDTLKNF